MPLESANRAHRVELPYPDKVYKHLCDQPLALSILTAVTLSILDFPISNQNPYFLHIIARWGERPFLHSDWLYSTAEPYIFFNYVHFFVGALAGFEQFATFLLFILLYSAGLYGMYRFLSVVFGVPSWFCAAFLIILCNQTTSFLLVKYHVPPPVSLFSGFANQSLFSPLMFYQPSSMACLYFLSLWLLVQSRISLSLVVACFVALLHPIYLITSFFFFCAVTTVFWKDTPLTKTVARSLLSLVIVAPIISYHAASNYGFAAEDISRASQILMNVSAPTETDIRQWFGYDDILRLGMIIVVLSFISRHALWNVKYVRTLMIIAAMSIVISIIAFVTGNGMLRLVQPWRTSVVYMPIFALFSVWTLTRPVLGMVAKRHLFAAVVLGAAVTSLSSPIIISYKWREWHREDRMLFDKVSELYSSTRGGRGVVAHMPRAFEEMRLRAGVPIFVDKKGAAFATGDLLEWERRLNLLQSVDFADCEGTALEMEREEIGLFVLRKDEDAARILEAAEYGNTPVLEMTKFVVFDFRRNVNGG